MLPIISILLIAVGAFIVLDRVFARQRREQQRKIRKLRSKLWEDQEY